MIIQTLQGTFSISTSEDLKEELLIKSNDLQSLCRLFDKSRVKNCTITDFDFCVALCKEELSNVLIKMVKQIDYNDFDQLMNELMIEKNNVFSKVPQ